MVAWVLRLVLAGVFAAAAVSKLLDPASFVMAVRSYGLVPGLLVPTVAYALPRFELLLALALGLGLFPRVTPRLTQVLLTVFIAAIGYRLLAGEPTPCGCFGGSEPLTWRTLVRDFGLICLAQGLVVLEAPGLFAGRRQEYAALAGALGLTIVAGLVLPLCRVPSYGVTAIGSALRETLGEASQAGRVETRPLALRVMDSEGNPVQLDFRPGEMWLVFFADSRCSLCGDIGRWLERNAGRLSGDVQMAVVVGGVMTEPGHEEPGDATPTGLPTSPGALAVSAEAGTAAPLLTPDQAGLVAESWGLNSAVYFDPGNLEAARYGLVGTPATLFVVDGEVRAGAVVAKQTPARRPDLMDFLGDSAGVAPSARPSPETPTLLSRPARPQRRSNK